MTKTDLIQEISAKTGLSKTQASDALNATLESISDALKNDDDVRIVGFGKFSAQKKEARKGRNPATGAEIMIPAKVNAKFKPGKELVDSLN